MKKLFLFHFLFISLFAYDDVDNKTAFDVLMFKSGVMSLTKDFEIEKENIETNTKEIETLKKEVKYLLLENMKLKLGVEDRSLQDENIQLKEQISKLKNRIQNVKKVTNVIEESTKPQVSVIPKPQIKAKVKPKSKPKQKINKSTSTKKSLKAIITASTIGVYGSMNPQNKLNKSFKYKDIVELEFCNAFEWCKLFNKAQYLPKYKLKILK